MGIGLNDRASRGHEESSRCFQKQKNSAEIVNSGGRIDVMAANMNLNIRFTLVAELADVYT